MEKVTLNGIEMPLIVGRKAAWTAIQAAGIKVHLVSGVKLAHDPTIDGGYITLTLVYDSRGAYPAVKYNGKVSGAFAATIRGIIENLIASAI